LAVDGIKAVSGADAEFDNEIGSTVVREGISGTSDVKLMMGKIIRIVITMSVIPLRRGAALWRSSLAKIHPMDRIKKEFKARVRIRSAVSAFSRIFMAILVRFF
jgi:hypothetical protein